MNAVLALTERLLRGGTRNLDIAFAVLTPVVTFVGFTIGLRDVIDTGGIGYPQYVLPAVVVQAMLFGALNTADLAAAERNSEFGARLRTLPMSTHAPLLARMAYCLVRGVLALLAAFGTAYAFGFRMEGGFLLGLAFMVVSLALTLALSLGADAAGARATRSDTSSQLLVIPQLLLVLLSTGMAPVESFPSWVRFFVEYQPVSQITTTLRGFASGHVASSNLLCTVCWCAGLFSTLGWLALRSPRNRR